jgi:type IV secretory pathway VirB10-like protein
VTEAPEPPASEKLDPETMVLRGRPARVVRFRRGVIIGAAALGSTALVGVAWVALKPPTFRVLANEDSRPEEGAKAPPDALANAPKTYGDVPVLGPPLPGDLGRPILKAQQSRAATAALGDPGAERTRRRESQAEAIRERLAAERKAARESGVLIQTSGAARLSTSTSTSVDGPVTPEPAGTIVAADRSTMSLDPVRDPGNQQRKADFLGEVSDRDDVNPHALSRPVSPYTLSAGSVIAASLLTGINSDLPGFITAQVTQNAYDSVTGRTLLIPQGSRLIGSYDSVVAFGQSRALVIWQRIILPNGSSLRIDNVPASDTTGFAGLADKVDLHTWQLLKGVALSTLLGVGTELSIGGEGDLVRAVRESTQQSASRAGDQIVTRNLNIQPTITVRPGWPLRVIVNKDLVLEPWSG